jgi:signal transduction histidine kinase
VPPGIAPAFDRAHVQLMTDKLSQHEAALLRAQRIARLAHVISRPDGSFESWSETLRELTGLDDEHMPRSTRAWIALIHPDRRGAFRSAALAAARSGARTEVEYLLGRADGTWVNIFQVIEPIAGEHPPGAGTRWFSTLQDVTVQVRAQEEVRRLNADLERRVADRTLELEAAMKELESFDYSISHDLRAPINRIVGFSDALAADYAAALDADGRELVVRIGNAAQHMDQLVRDLFSLSTVSRGELRRSVVDVTALARTILSGLQRAEPSRHVEVVVADELVAWADPGLLRIVLENLLNNAWKFSRRREGARIEVASASSDGGKAFFVRDNGAGFDPARAAKLFSPFQRLHSAQDFEGTGIGLATVSRIVARHGGRVWAEGKVDVGATIHFTLSR